MVRSLTPQQLTWQKMSPTHEKNLNGALTAYGQSKFANILFASELNRRLSPMGVTAYSLHPGVVDTSIKRNTKLISTFMCCCGCTTDSVVSLLAFSVYLSFLILSTVTACGTAEGSHMRPAPARPPILYTTFFAHILLMPPTGSDVYLV